MRDALLKFSDGQAVTATAVSTNVIDLGPGSGDVGPGTQLYVVLTLGAAFVGLTSLQASLQTSDAQASGFADVIAGAAVPLANLTAGALFVIPVPPGMKRYARLNYTVAGGPATAGSITAAIGLDYPAQTIYPSGFQVD